MDNPIAALQPGLVWQFFDKIRQIPRGSGNERAVGDALLRWAEEAGCIGRKDTVGNVVISVPASPGAENAPITVLQSHMDMVCEKDKGHDFDFEKDPIVLVRDGDWITADRTTLGADNGIGMAVSLAMMTDKAAVHGPLEILVTVEEETGLTGAAAVDPSLVTGRLLFNLDSEDDGVFCVGCAGGMDSRTVLPVERETFPKSRRAFELSVKGLRGGHSGVDILDNRANALVLGARVLQPLLADVGIGLSWFMGGDKHNAVPREAFASVVVSDEKESEFLDRIAMMEKELKEEFGSWEPRLSVTATKTEMPASMLTAASAAAVVQASLAFPNGVLSMMREMPGIVETSNNLARIRCDEKQFTFLNSSRSSIHAAILGVSAKLRAVSELCGGQYEILSSYPGWQPNMSSPLLARAEAVWRRLHGEAPKIEVIHAGLECGIIGEKLPGMDMISLGPTIENPHSPDERVSISSTERFYEFVKVFLEEVAGVSR